MKIRLVGAFKSAGNRPALSDANVQFKAEVAQEKKVARLITAVCRSKSLNVKIELIRSRVPIIFIFLPFDNHLLLVRENKTIRASLSSANEPIWLLVKRTSESETVKRSAKSLKLTRKTRPERVFPLDARNGAIWRPLVRTCHWITLHSWT